MNEHTHRTIKVTLLNQNHLIYKDYEITFPRAKGINKMIGL